MAACRAGRYGPGRADDVLPETEAIARRTRPLDTGREPAAAVELCQGEEDRSALRAVASADVGLREQSRWAAIALWKNRRRGAPAQGDDSHEHKQ